MQNASNVGGREWTTSVVLVRSQWAYPFPLSERLIAHISAPISPTYFTFHQSIWTILFVWHNFFFILFSRSANIPKRIFNNRMRINDWESVTATHIHMDKNRAQERESEQEMGIYLLALSWCAGYDTMGTKSAHFLRLFEMLCGARWVEKAEKR